jgi:hypothetical protein
MHGRSRWLLIVLSLVLAAPAVAAADPAQIYTDFANTGKLRCGYAAGDLRALLNDAAIAEYSDPSTLRNLRIAIRGQLAGSCSAGSTASPGTGTGGTTSNAQPTTSVQTVTATTGSPDGTTGVSAGPLGVPDDPTTTETVVAQGPIDGGSGGGSSLALIAALAAGAVGLLGFLGWKIRRTAERG